MKRTLLSLALTMALLLSACSAGVTALQPGRAAPEAPARRDAALDTALGDFGLNCCGRPARRARTPSSRP